MVKKPFYRPFCSKLDINDVIHAPVKSGVGPWQSELPTESHYDIELLKNGDSRNVIDKYRYWKMEAIKRDLDAHKHAFHVAIENWEHDSNIGSIVRTANAFNASKVHIIGNRKWNKKGAMVTDRYQHIQHHPDFGSLSDFANSLALPIIGIDNTLGSLSILGNNDKMPLNCILLFGQERLGLSEKARKSALRCLFIPQYGSTRSINAGAAAAIAMYHWITIHATK